jgi:hypothetical protein
VLPCLERDGIEGPLYKFMLYIYLVIMEPFCKMMRSHAAVAFGFEAARCTEYYVYKSSQGEVIAYQAEGGRTTGASPRSGPYKLFPGFLVIVGTEARPPTSRGS